jgi:hypothetical protein
MGTNAHHFFTLFLGVLAVLGFELKISGLLGMHSIA